MNVCLVGDSILDNAAYTNGDLVVVDRLNRVLGEDGRVTFLAVDAQ